MHERDLPIGVFDSGLGGLTVAAALRRALPAEDIVYLGDNARVPYGTRSAATVMRYAHNCASFLVAQRIKLLVVACNTVSAVAIDALRRAFPVPVLGVIEAGARAAVPLTVTGKVGVIGTQGTVSSGAYVREMGALNPRIAVFQNPAPLLVPLVEEGWLDGPVPHLAVQRYIAPLAAAQVDVLLLGCTHYPVLRPVIEHEMNEVRPGCAVVDSAVAMAAEVARFLDARALRTSRDTGRFVCHVTDLPETFAQTAARFFPDPMEDVRQVDIV